MDEVKRTLEKWFGMKFGDGSDTRFRHYVSNRLGISWSLEGQTTGRFFELDLNKGLEKKIKFTVIGEALLPDSELDKTLLLKLNEKLKMIENIFQTI